MWHDWIPLAVILGILCLAVGGLFAWSIWRLRNEATKQEAELMQYTRRFRQWRNQQAETVVPNV